MPNNHTEQTVTDKKSNEHKAFWQARTAKSLQDEDVRQINENLAGFFSVLNEWKENSIKAQKP